MRPATASGSTVSATAVGRVALAVGRVVAAPAAGVTGAAGSAVSALGVRSRPGSVRLASSRAGGVGRARRGLLARALRRRGLARRRGLGRRSRAASSAARRAAAAATASAPPLLVLRRPVRALAFTKTRAAAAVGLGVFRSFDRPDEICSSGSCSVYELVWSSCLILCYGASLRRRSHVVMSARGSTAAASDGGGGLRRGLLLNNCRPLSSSSISEQRRDGGGPRRRDSHGASRGVRRTMYDS